MNDRDESGTNDQLTAMGRREDDRAVLPPPGIDSEGKRVWLSQT